MSFKKNDLRLLPSEPVGDAQAFWIYSTKDTLENINSKNYFDLYDYPYCSWKKYDILWVKALDGCELFKIVSKSHCVPIEILPIFESLEIKNLKISEALTKILENGEIVNIQDFSSKEHSVKGSFRVQCYTKDPTWYTKDIDNFLYKHKNRDKTYLINCSITDFPKINSKDAKKLKEILEGTLYYETDTKLVKVVIDGKMRTFTLEKEGN